ncbi:MAG: hypothetical protein IJM46_12175 [Oscillospiraceae bacterium]|nr:hypothetical protein [Oscillospiraceae bacterium]
MEQTASAAECLTVDVKTCAKMLGLGLRSTYRLVERSYREHSPLHVARFGSVYRISVSSIRNLFTNTGG